MPDRTSRTRRRTTPRRWLLAVVLALPAFAPLATTSSEVEVDDPIAPGQTCRVQKPGSYGSYIYYWPSRFDFVFCPLTDSVGIWHCDRYLKQLNSTIEGISDAELSDHLEYLSELATQTRLIQPGGPLDPVRE